MDLIHCDAIGVVASIAPWNYPLMMAAWKIAPTLAAGNTVVLKPSEQTPLSTLLLAQVAAEIFPKGVPNVITGRGATVGQPLVQHPKVSMVSVTGDVSTGRKILQAATGTLKRTHLELGGKAPVLVFDDAGIASVVEVLRTFGYYNASQDCTAACRVYAGAKIYDRLVAHLSSAVKTIRMGLQDDADAECRSRDASRDETRYKGQRTKLTILTRSNTIRSTSSRCRPMSKTTSSAALLDGVLTLQPWAPGAGTGPRASATGQSGHTYLIRVQSDVLSKVLEAVVPVLGRLLSEKTSEVREQKLEALVDFMAGQMVVPSAVDTQMAQRLAVRHARVLNEFGFISAEQLADANQSRAANRNALADNWKKRRQVFAVRHRDDSGKQREVFPLFQFDDHKPIKAVQGVLAAFGERKAPWKIALWFTSNNGWLPGQARPVDLLASASDAVVQAAQRDAAGSAA